VVTLFLGPYLTAVAKAGAGPDGYIHPFGVQVDPRSLWGYLVSISVLSQVLVLPLVGAIADYGRRKREILGALAYTGAIATMGLFFVEGSNYLLGAALFLVANLAFGASMVVYNAFLPEIAAQFQALVAEAQNVADVEIVSATTLGDEQKARLAAALSTRLRRDVRLQCTVDPELIGGAVVRSGDLLIDGSLKGKLERLETELTG
jgi:MFS family permease